MKCFGQLFIIAVMALSLWAVTPMAAFASVPIGCTFTTSAVSSAPLQATTTLTCPADMEGITNVDDASWVGPATVHIYSGSDINWTKITHVSPAGTYKLRVTITVQTQAGPVTGSSTCCRTTIYGAAPTPTPVITPPPATPRPVATPRPATPRPVVTPRPAASTDTPVPTDTPSASPSESPTISASPSEPPIISASPSESPSASVSATPEPTASPSAGNAPAVGTTSGGSDLEPLLAAGLIALWLLAAALLVLVLLRRKRRKAAPAVGQPAQ